MATATTLSMAEAARGLGRSRAAVSVSIHRLEANLGVKLFEHDRNRLVLTKAGERCLCRLRPVLEDLHSAMDDLSGDPESAAD